MTERTAFGTWSLESEVPIIVANGRTYQAEVGQAFDKAVFEAAQAAGYSGSFYVKASLRPGDPLIMLANPNDAPKTMEPGMRVELSPYSEAAA